jgi:hypothetical protein
MPHAKAAKLAKKKKGFQVGILCELCTAIARIHAVSERFFTTDFPERRSRNQKDFEQEETEETESGKKSSQKCTIPSFSGTDFTDKRNPESTSHP